MRCFSILFFVLCTLVLPAQENPLDVLERRLRQGDKDALIEMARYIDSQKEIIRFLGYHRIETTEASVTISIVQENTLFTPKELALYDTVRMSKKTFLDFIGRNQHSLVFSDLAKAFLITPLENREAKFETREMSPETKKNLAKKFPAWMEQEWAIEKELPTLISNHDPQALLVVASVFFQQRNRFNEYDFNEETYIGLLKHLLGLEMAVENEKHEMTWHLESEFYPASRLNLLVHFAKNYREYKWDEQRQVFAREGELVRPSMTEEMLFESLSDENDLVARNAFVQLTTGSPAQVVRLSNEYEKARKDFNYILPTFPYRFLKQMVEFTAYCTKKQIDFTGSPALRQKIHDLMSRLNFKERRQLEDDLIRTLTLEEINVLEYWAMVDESSFALSHSAGRILDIFYSNHFDELVHNEKHLDLYLKKACLFDQLGIIGVCNRYLVKFRYASPAVLETVKNHPASDGDVKRQKQRVADLVKERPNKSHHYSWEGNKNNKVADLDKKLQQLTTGIKDSVETENQLVELLSRISYNQIGIAIKFVETYPFSKRNEWKKYSFLRDDWGFFSRDDFDDVAIRNKFLDLYNSLTEYQLYAHYLDEAGIDYKRADGSLDYDKIYDLIRFDLVTAFVGGGGGTYINEVYALIKLMELTFKTTLGHPDKICHSQSLYSCDCYSRMRVWMTYMEKKKLLQKKHDSPVSFSHDPDFDNDSVDE